VSNSGIVFAAQTVIVCSSIMPLKLRLFRDVVVERRETALAARDHAVERDCEQALLQIDYLLQLETSSPRKPTQSMSVLPFKIKGRHSAK
jgi:hypothetical protein